MKFFEKQKLSSIADVPSLSKSVGIKLGPPLRLLTALPKVLIRRFKCIAKLILR